MDDHFRKPVPIWADSERVAALSCYDEDRGKKAARAGKDRQSHPQNGDPDETLAWLAGYDAEIEAQAGRADEPPRIMGYEMTTAELEVYWKAANTPVELSPAIKEQIQAMDPSPYPALFPKDAFCQQQKELTKRIGGLVNDIGDL